ncbi:Uncharacterized protein PRO82_000376 [Candidatus Protochlamydia amoebophila]|nr:Uncharacterized protein [Candidatus Protochlamydia amoebophila]
MQISLKSPIETLPEETKVAIFNQLKSPKDLAMASLVSKAWQQLAEDPSLWKAQFCRQWKKLTFSTRPTLNSNWKKIYKKRHQILKEVRRNKATLCEDRCKHDTYQLPGFAASETVKLKVEKKVAFIQVTPGNAQVYFLEEKGCQLVFDNLKDENSRLIHYLEGHMIQVTQEGSLYRWPLKEPFPSQPLSRVGNFEEAYVDQELLILVLPQRKQFAIFNIEDGLKCYESPLFRSSIRSLDCRDNQILIQCEDGTLYFIKAIRKENASQNLEPILLEGLFLDPLSKELVQFDEKRVIILGKDAGKRLCTVWDAASGKKNFEGSLERESKFHLNSKSKCITASAYNGEKLAVGFDKGYVVFYEPTTGKKITTHSFNLSPVQFLNFDSDQEHCWVATNPYYLIKCLNIKDKPETMGAFCSTKQKKKLEDRGAEALKCNLTGIYADERRLACCDKEGELDVWDFAKASLPHSHP